MSHRVDRQVLCTLAALICWAVSAGVRVCATEDAATESFELTPAANIGARILMPDDKPAAGAKVALGIAGMQIDVDRGDFDDRLPSSARTQADEAGWFHFPPQDGSFQVIVIHPAGYAHVVATADEPLPTAITLEAWARVEGTLRIGQKLAENEAIAMDPEVLRAPGVNLPNVWIKNAASTDNNGHFVFERLIPGGRTRIYRPIDSPDNQGVTKAMSNCTITIGLTAGETSRVEMGGSGRAVVGTLEPHAEFVGEPKWNFARLQVRSYLQPPANPRQLMPREVRRDAQRTQAWMQAWLLTDLGRQWQAEYAAFAVKQELRRMSPVFTATVDADGRFRIDDVPAGEYTLSLRIQRNAPGRMLDLRFVVPEAEEGETDEAADEPLDLGVLTLSR